MSTTDAEKRETLEQQRDRVLADARALFKRAGGTMKGDDLRHSFLISLTEDYCRNCGSISGYRCTCMRDD